MLGKVGILSSIPPRRNTSLNGIKLGSNLRIPFHVLIKSAILLNEQNGSIAVYLHFIFECSFIAFIAVAMDYVFYAGALADGID